MDKKDFIVWASRIAENYKPSEDVLSKISQVELYAVVGPTGAGKSTILKTLNLHQVLSDVSRDRRPNEKDGVDYHFKDDYLAMAEDIKRQQYVQFLVSTSGEFYGTRASEYPDNGPATMAIYATAIPHFREIGFKKIVPIYIMPPSYVEWMRRIGGVRTQDLLTRISEARTSMLIAVEDPDYHFVLNDNLDLALTDIKSIIAGGDIDERRKNLARETVDLLLEHIGDEA